MCVGVWGSINCIVETKRKCILGIVKDGSNKTHHAQVRKHTFSSDIFLVAGLVCASWRTGGLSITRSSLGPLQGNEEESHDINTSAATPTTNIGSLKFYRLLELALVSFYDPGVSDMYLIVTQNSMPISKFSENYKNECD